jgi:phospholipid/cholesterol/gamma-HCH transport system substrate-binding protein
MEERRLELKVGILLAVALAGAVGLLYLLGEFHLIGGARVFANFAHSGGVPPGAPIKMAGVRVGRVRNIELLPSRRDDQGAALPVRMELEIIGDIFKQLHSDAPVSMASQGALGEPYLEIATGSANQPPLAAGAQLRGEDPPRIDLISARLYDVLNGASNMMGKAPEVQSLFKTATGVAKRAESLMDQAGPAVTQAVDDIGQAAKELRSVANAANAALKDDGEIGRLLADARAIAGQLRKDVPAIAEKAQQAVDGAAALTGSVTPADVARLKEAIGGYEKAGATLAEVATRAERILARIENGEGSIGGLAKDPQVYQDLKALVTDLKKHPWKVLWKD